MKKYVLKRVLTAIVTLLVILLVLFILMQLMPGSPFNDEKLNDDQRAALYAKYGLDQPVFIQFLRYVANMLRGDFGVSYNISKNTPISQLIQTRLPISIMIGGMAVLLGAVVGLLLGLLAALKHDTWVDTICTILSVIGVSVPSYVFALGLSYYFGFKLKWFPMLFSPAADVPVERPALDLAVDVHDGLDRTIHPLGDARGHGQRVHAACRVQGAVRLRTGLPPCASQRPDPHHHSARSAHRRSDDRLPCRREDLLDPRRRFPSCECDPVQ